MGEWWDAGSKNRVDVVALGASGDLLVGECKWGRITADHLASLRRRAELLAAELKGVTTVYTAVFSGRDEVDAEVRREAAAGTTLVFSAEDLREEAPAGGEGA